MATSKTNKNKKQRFFESKGIFNMKTGRYSIVLVITLIAILSLTLFVIAGNIQTQVQANKIKITNYSTDWNLLKKTGFESNFDFTIDKQNKEEICIYQIAGSTFNGNVDFELKNKNGTSKEKLKISKKTGLWCYTYKNKGLAKDDYVQIGNSTILMIYQDLKRIDFSIDNNYNLTNILYKNMSNNWNNTVNDIEVSYDGIKWKIKGTDIYGNSTKWNQYKYVFSSNADLIKKGSYYYFKSPTSITGYKVDMYDICSQMLVNKTNPIPTNWNILQKANCQFNSYSLNGLNYLEVTFYNNGSIDPSYTFENLQSEQTLLNITFHSPNITFLTKNTLYPYNNLFLYYPFDADSGSAIDFSGLNNDGTYNGGTTISASGKYDDALSLAGGADYVSASAISGLNAKMTGMAWINPADGNNYAYVWDFGGNDHSASLYPGDSATCAGTPDVTDCTTYGTQSPCQANNAHGGCSWGGGTPDTCSGTETACDIANFGTVASCNAQSGCIANSNGACSTWDNTDQATCETGHEGCTWSDPSCLGSYYDSCTGTATTCGSFTESGPCGAQAVCSWGGGTPDTCSGTATCSGLAQYGNASCIAELTCGPFTSGNYNLFCYQGGAQSSTRKVYVNTWNHVACAWNATNVIAYVNGTQDGSSTSDAQVPGAINLGRYSGGGYAFNGKIDEFMVFNSTLNAGNISDIYNEQSLRFLGRGEQKFNVSLTGDTTLNVSLLKFENNSGSYFAFKVNTGNEVNFTNGNVTNYDLTGLPGLNNANITIVHYAGTNQFYTPILWGNINTASWGTGGDTTKPLIQFVSPTETSGPYLNRSNIQVNVTASDETALANITINLYNITGLVNSSFKTTSPFYINFTGLPDNLYYFNATALDTSGNLNNTITYNVTIDKTYPLIDWGVGTLADNSIVSQSNIYLNTTWTEINYHDITFYADTSAGWDYTSPPQYDNNFTSVADGVHLYYVTICDFAGNCNSTTTRTITLDTTKPAINIVSPSNNTNQSVLNVAINYTLSDANLQSCWWTNNTGLSNHSITCGTNISGVNWNKGSNTIIVYANDSLNQINSSSVTFNIDAVAPAINFVSPTPSSGSSQTGTSIYLNLSTSDLNQHYSLVDFDNSLELFVRFDDTSSGDYTDLSVYGAYVNTTLVSGVVNGKFGNAINLSGNAQYLDIGDKVLDNRFLDYLVIGRRPSSAGPALHPTSLTLSQWIYPLSNTTNQAIFADMDHDQRGYSLLLNSAGKLVLYMGGTAPSGTAGENGANAIWTTSSSLNANQWYHVVAQMDVINNQTKIYLDSVNQALTEVNGSIGFNYTYDFTPVSPTRLTYGARVNISTNDINSRDSFFNGYLDELLVFDRVLSQNEVSALYNASSTQYSTNYTNLGYMNYSFLGYSVDVLGNKNQTAKQTIRVYDANADTTAPNITFVSPSQTAGYANSNTTINITSTDTTNKTFSFFTDNLVGWWDFDEGNGTFFLDKSGMGANGTCSGNTCPFFEHTGAFGGKYRFDGENDFINLSTASSVQPNETFSVSAWVKTAGQGYRKSQYIIKSGSWGYYFKLDDGVYSFWLAVNTSSPYSPLEVSTTNPGQYIDEQWHNIAVTFNHTALIIYVDGNQDNIATTTYSYPAFYTSQRFTFIGSNSQASYWSDYLDELMIFNRTLTAPEIKALYNASSQSYQRSFTNLAGTNNYTIKSVDAFGNVATSSIGFIIDDVKPTITVYSPTNTTYNSSSVLINFTGTDTSPLTYKYYNQISNVTYTSANAITLTDGNYSYIFYVTDAAGNQNSTTVNFSVAIPATVVTTGGSSSSNSGTIVTVSNNTNITQNGSQIKTNPITGKLEPGKPDIISYIVQNITDAFNWAAFKISPRNQTMGIMIVWGILLLAVFSQYLRKTAKRIRIRGEYRQPWR